jgi:D-alanyl-D-alanine carboxypeptidase
MSASISSLIPELQPFARDLLRVAGAAGLQPRITSTRRSSAEQTRLYRRFLAGQNPYPVAPPGTSAHEFGYAFDMMIQAAPGQMESDLADLGQVWTSWGGVWGGAFKDPIHFEYPGFPHKELAPVEGGEFAKLVDLISSLVPGLGELQLIDALANWIDPHDTDKISWYLQHPAEALRDLFG